MQRFYQYLIESTSITVKGKKIKLNLQPRVKSDHKIVFVNSKFDKAFSKQKDFYINRGGRNQLKDRYDAFEMYLFGGERKIGNFSMKIEPHSDMEVSIVSVRDNGDVFFTDGRHRYSYLRDNMSGKIPVSMDAQSIRNAKAHGYL